MIVLGRIKKKKNGVLPLTKDCSLLVIKDPISECFQQQRLAASSLYSV